MQIYQKTYEQGIKRRDLNERIKRVIVNQLKLDIEPAWITDDQPLFGRGLSLDSIDILDLALGIEEEFDVSIHDDDIAAFGSVNRMADFILSQTGEDYAALAEPTRDDDLAEKDPWFLEEDLDADWYS